MQRNKRFSIQKLVLVALLAALVFILSQFSIPVGDSSSGSRIHMGNIMCLLSGLLFGPWVGGLAAGVGSMMYDLFSPLYITEFWITFITKFAMGFAAGALNRHLLQSAPEKLRLVVSGMGGAGLYVVLYTIKSIIWQHFVLASPWPAVWPVVATKVVTSSVNAAMAVVGSTMLAMVLTPALRATGLLGPRPRHT